jgi:hypothetical protein
VSNGSGSEDYCCILCGFKEQSVDRLKDHINLHFIGQMKRQLPAATASARCQFLLIFLVSDTLCLSSSSALHFFR